ncbi:septin 7 [Cricetulus griseus]
MGQPGREEGCTGLGRWRRRRRLQQLQPTNVLLLASPSPGATRKQPKNLEGYVGFANLPNQVYRKSVKRGFEFTLMVVGESGLGKSTLINSLFLTDLYSPEYPGPSHRIKKTVQVEQAKVLIKEGGVQLLLTIVDTPGFGDAVDNSNCWQPVIDYIDSKFEDYLNAESRVNRRQMPDNRVQCCLYFIAPSGHGLKPLDIEFMKRLHEKVNIIPLIAKADTLTPEECQQFKKQIMKEIQEHKIKIYEFPETDDEEENKLVKKIKVVILSSKLMAKESEEGNILGVWLKLQRRHEQMKKNLEAQHKELEEKRRQFEEEKANWEAQQRILEQQNSSRVTDSDMALSSSCGPDDTVALGDRAGHSNHHGPSSATALRHPHGYSLQSRPWASMWSLLATWTMDINTDLGCVTVFPTIYGVRQLMITYSTELFPGFIEILSMTTGPSTVALAAWLLLLTHPSGSISPSTANAVLWPAHQTESDNAWQPLPYSPQMSCHMP